MVSWAETGPAVLKHVADTINYLWHPNHSVRILIYLITGINLRGISSSGEHLSAPY